MSRRVSLLVLVLLAFWAAGVSAAPVTTYCPGPGPAPTAPNTRIFWITLDGAAATCLAYGDGNLNAETAAQDVMIAGGWTALDKDPGVPYTGEAWFEITGVGNTTGTFTVFSAAWSAGSGFKDLAFGLKSGNNMTPDWAVFLLPGSLFTGASLTGTWGTAPTQGGGLSHANLYGDGTPDEHPPVPEPASMVLFGTGLLGLARARRRKN